MRGNLRKPILALIFLLALAALAYRSRHAIHLGDFTWSKFVQAVSQANVPLLLLAIVGIYVCYAIRALRWQRFSRYLGPAKYWNTYSGTVIGFAAIFLLGRPGELVRPIVLARKDNLPTSGMFGIYVVERLFDFGCAIGLAVLSLLVFPRKLAEAGADPDAIATARHGGWVLVGVLALVIALLVYFRLHGAGALNRILERWRAAGGWRGKSVRTIVGFSEGLQAIRNIPDLAMAVVYSVVHWTLVAFIFLWITRAFGDAFSDMNFPGAMLLLAITLVGSALQLPGVGGGAQVGSFIALTTVFGVEQEPAAVAAIVLWLISFAASTLAGIPLLIHEGWSMGELRQLARAEAEAEKKGGHIAVPGVKGKSSSGAKNDRGENSK